MSKKPKLAAILPLDEQTRALLLNRYPPVHERVFCRHIVLKWQGVGPNDPLIAHPMLVEIYGHYTGPISQVLAVTVDGAMQQPDGTPFHITLSAKPDVVLKDARVIDPDAMEWFAAAVQLRLRMAIVHKQPTRWEPRSRWLQPTEGVAA